MYGPYPALGFGDRGQLDAATGTLYWILSATYNGTDTYEVVISYISRDIVLHSVTCTVVVGTDIGNGSPGGRLLRDPSTGFFYINVENSYGYSTWFQFDSTGTYLADLGLLGFGGGPLLLCQDAILDGGGNLVHLTTGASATFVTLSPFVVAGSVSLTYTGSSRVTIGAANSIWILSTDGSNGAIDLLNLPANAPTVTTFSLGAGGAGVQYTIEYDAVDDTLLFWWNSLLIKWSCGTHTIVNSISSTYIGSGPLQAGLLTAGIGFYVASDLSVSPLTGVGHNPGLPTFLSALAFKHFYDSGFEVIWLQADDTNVYGVVFGLFLSCASGFGQIGVPYGSSLTAIGGTPPYTFAIISGSLPPGLTLNASTGAITGVPTTAGVYPYTAQVTDAADETATASCTIVIPALVTIIRPMPTLEINRDLDADWGDHSTFFITQDEPLPFTLRGLVLRLSYNQD